MTTNVSPLAESIEAAMTWLSEIDGSSVDQNLIGSAQLYIETENPVYAWQAFLLCSGKVIPGWVRLFLEDQACAVLRFANTGDVIGKEWSARLAAELGFSTKGRGKSPGQRPALAALAGRCVLPAAPGMAFTTALWPRSMRCGRWGDESATL